MRALVTQHSRGKLLMRPKRALTDGRLLAKEIVKTLHHVVVIASAISLCFVGSAPHQLAEASEVEKVPAFTQELSLTGEQANALLTAVKTLRSNHVSNIAQYEISISQAAAVIAVFFRQPGRHPYQVPSENGPPEFEVWISRQSGNVLKAHFER
jgi:hypothetical protein